MSRMERVKAAIASTLNEVEINIKAIHEQGGTAPLDMIGFRNGLALADHHINMRDGQVKMIQIDPRRLTRVQKVESLPEIAEADEQEYEYLVDKVLGQSRAVCWTSPGEELDRAIRELGHKIKELDQFIDDKLKQAGKAQLQSVPDAGLPKQEGSIPSLAAVPSPEEFNGA